MEAHAEAVVAVDCHPLQPQVLSGSLDGTVRVWDLSTLHCLLTLHDGNKVPISGCKYTGSGKYVMCSTLNSNHSLWNVEGIHPVNMSVAVPPAVTGGAYKLQSNSDHPAHGVRRRFTGHVNKVYNIHTAIAGSANRGYICSGSEDNGVYVWDVNPVGFPGSGTVPGGEVLPYKRLLAHTGIPIAA